MSFIFHYFITPFAVFVAGYLLLRLMGKKAVAEMTSFELLVVLVVGTSISEPIVTKRLGVAVWYSLAVSLIYIGFIYLSLNNRFKRLLTASPTVLVRGGDIDQEALKKVKMSIEQLSAELRVKGYPRVADVEMAAMESTGEVSVIPKADVRPLQPSDLQITPKPSFIPIPIIIDGEIMGKNLRFVGKDYKWLNLQLNANSLSYDDINEISLATYNQDGFLDLDTKNPNDHSEGVYNYKPGSDDTY